MNKVQLIGRVTKDIELKKTQSSKSVVTFTLAVRKDKDNSDFISCVAWNKTAELLSQYVKKGDRLAVCGRIQTRNYDGQNGKVYVTEVIADEIEFLESKKEEQQSTQAVQSYARNDVPTYIDDDDLPF